MPQSFCEALPFTRSRVELLLSPNAASGAKSAVAMKFLLRHDDRNLLPRRSATPILADDHDCVLAGSNGS